MAKVRIDFVGVDKVSQIIDGFNKKLDETDKKTKTVKQQQEEMARAAKKVWSETRTPLERHNIRLDKLNQLLKAGKISQETFGRAVQQANRRLQQQTSIFGQLFGKSSIQQMQRYVVGLASITTILASIRQAFMEVLQAQNAAFGTVQSIAGGQRSAIANLGRASAEQKRGFLNQAEAIGAELGLTPGIASQEAGELFSATRGGNFEERQRTVMRTLRATGGVMRRTRQSEIGELGGTIQDIERILPPSARGAPAFGLALSALEQSRIQSVTNLKNVAGPSLAFATLGGTEGATLEDVRSGMALFAMIGGDISDPNGELTRTGVALFAKTLRDEIPGPYSTSERLQRAIRNPQILERVVSKLPGRSTVKVALENFLRDKDAQAEFFDVRAQIRPDAALADKMSREAASLTPELRSATRQEVMTARGARDATTFGGRADIESVRQGLFSTQQGAIGALRNQDVVSTYRDRALFEAMQMFGVPGDIAGALTAGYSAVMTRGPGGSERRQTFLNAMGRLIPTPVPAPGEK